MKLVDKTIINIFSKSSEAGLLLLSSVILVRYLSKGDYGTFLQILLIINTTIMFTNLGISHSIYYYMHQTENKSEFILRNFVIIFSINCMAALGIYLLMDNIVEWLKNPLLLDYKYAVSILIILRGPTLMREPLLISQGNLILNSITLLASNSLFFIPVIIATFLSYSLHKIIDTLLISLSIDLICFLFLMGYLTLHLKRKKINHQSSNNNRIALSEQLRYALPIGLSSYVGVIGRQMDQYIVSLFFTPQSFAVYSRGALRIPVLSNIQYIVNDIMMPNYVRNYLEGNIKKLLSDFQLCAEKVAKINFPVFAFLFIVSPSLVSLLYTTKYLGAVPIFRTYLFLLLINITTFGIIPRASGKTQSIFYASILNVIANVILSLFLVPYLGAVGAALATIICAFLSSIYYLFMSCRILNVGISMIFPWKFLFSYLTISLLAGLPVMGIDFLQYYAEIQLLPALLFKGIIYFFGFIFLVMRFNLLSTEDLSILSRWMRFDASKLFKKLALMR